MSVVQPKNETLQEGGYIKKKVLRRALIFKLKASPKRANFEVPTAGID